MINLIATKTPVTKIPARAMLDLEPLGDGGLRDEYARYVDTLEAADGVVLLAQYGQELITLSLPADAEVDVVTYAASNALETWVDGSPRG